MMCYWYTPNYDGCHNCYFSSEGMTTGKTYTCSNHESIWERSRYKERTQHKLGNLPCDHTCNQFTKSKGHT